jgi:hypothetical protein
VEHQLPIKEGFQPFQQAPRRMAPDITLKIKEEIERLVLSRLYQTNQVCQMVIKYSSCFKEKWQA